MTFSDAWIEPGDDADFAKFIEQRGRRGLLPTPDRPHWINHVKDWAQREGLPVEYPDFNVVRVPVTCTQLQRFLEQMRLQNGDLGTMSEYVRLNGRDDCTYAIVADEF